MSFRLSSMRSLIQKVERNRSKFFGYIVLTAFLGFVMIPVLWLLALSLKTRLQAFADPPLLIFRPTLQNFIELFVEADFLNFFMNSFIVAAGATLVSLAIGVPAAFGLSRMRYRIAAKYLFIWILAARMAPAMTYVIPFFTVYSQIGIVDTRYGLVIAYLTLNLPVVIVLMRSFFEDIPRSLEESAIVDGATMSQSFFHVVVPVAVPGIVSAGILTFVLSWNEFIFALVLTRREAVTAPIAIINFMRYEGTEWGLLAAGGIILVLPAIMMMFFVGNYITHGLTKGAVKE